VSISTDLDLAPDRTGDDTLSPTEEQHRDLVDDEPDLVQIPVADLIIALWQRRIWLAKVAALGLVISFGLALLAFLIPNRFSSTAQLMPPDSSAFSSISMLNFLEGPSFGGFGAGGLFSNRSAGTTAIGVLESRTVQDNIINRFDLRRKWRCKLEADARKSLLQKSTFTEDKKTGIISITVEVTDKYLARDIVQAYIDELNSLVNSLSSSSAHRERLFLEQRLKDIKADLDSSSQALSQFSSRNSTFDPSKQVAATAEAASRLQGELIAYQSELSGLKQMYSDDNVRVREAQARIGELQSQLRKMGGQGVKENDASPKTDELFPSIRELPLLGNTYYDLYRRVTMNEAIYETLTKQYEIAKVQEAKEIPRIQVLDAPDIPERKSGPHRSFIIIIGFFLSVFGGVVWIVASKLWEITDDSSGIKRSGMAIARKIRGHEAGAAS
jgi:capsule polysaccharide export protein KpsE/RkpR